VSAGAQLDASRSFTAGAAGAKAPSAFETSGGSPPTYLTVDEVAALLRVSRATVYRLVGADPTLPVLPLPGLLRFPRERFLRWLRDREQGRGRPRRARAARASELEGCPARAAGASLRQRISNQVRPSRKSAPEQTAA
jgi:excisionase family DNA binding protein